MSHKFTFIDLFAGIGGFHSALTSIGGKCIGYSEIDKNAINAYQKNYHLDDSLNFGDITKLTEIPYCDLLTAGVPCQSWSTAGKKLGFEDDRGQLWNDTIYLLSQSKPKAFIFENVKGLTDPRNKESFDYILNRIKEAGYFANYYLLSSSDYGVPQARERVYIIGFKDKKNLDNFLIPEHVNKHRLFEFLDNKDDFKNITLYDKNTNNTNSLSSNSGFNDYFLFNDIRGGDTTLHSWDILDTTLKQKEICLSLLKNRRKKIYGPMDGNPLSLNHFKNLLPDFRIDQLDLDLLVGLNILKPEKYHFTQISKDYSFLSDDEILFVNAIPDENFIIEDIKNNNIIKKLNRRFNFENIVNSLLNNEIIKCNEVRYDFKNSKISTGLFGINRIFMPNSYMFSTLVATQSKDFIATKMIYADTIEEYRKKFIEEIYKKGYYRQLTKSEACRIQGFPENFILPEKQNQWMKLIGNSVSVPVIKLLSENVIKQKV